MSNITTADSGPISPRPRAEYILIPFLAIIGLLLALGICIKRRQRNDELRHRLIPLINYSRSRQDSDGEDDRDEDDDEELKEPLRRAEMDFEGILTFGDSL